ncbi:3-hydroxyacyl-CoA dehydrogenase family protein [soil metagenome]
MSAEKVAVVGAGTMGQGIAYVAAVAGYQVTITDAASESVTRALDGIRESLRAGVERRKVAAADYDAILARIISEPGLAEAVRNAEIVIEAVPEDLALKRKLVADIEAAAPETALLASNTSSLSISEIATAVRIPERVIGLHFFNPVHAMKLVEIVRGRSTTDATVERAQAFAAALGKTSIVVQDTPGFATSRLGVVLGLEAMRMVEQGVASAEDIDTAMQLGYNHPVGPLKLTDLVGLDVRLAIADHLHATLGGDTYLAPELLRRLVAEGKLGKKSGEGFYRWPASDR